MGLSVPLSWLHCFRSIISQSTIMAELEDTHFESGDSGASATYPQQCSALRKNGFLMLREEPAKSSRCRLPKPASTGTLKYTWLELIFSTERNLKISVRPPTTWMSPLSREKTTLWLTLLKDI